MFDFDFGIFLNSVLDLYLKLDLIPFLALVAVKKVFEKTKKEIEKQIEIKKEK